MSTLTWNDDMTGVEVHHPQCARIISYGLLLRELPDGPVSRIDILWLLKERALCDCTSDEGEHFDTGPRGG